MKARILILLLCPLLLLCGCHKEEQGTPTFSTIPADDDFTNLFSTAAKGGDALMVVTIEKSEEVEDVIEYYDVIDTLYTKVTARLERELTDQVEGDTVTLYLLGNSENFPRRETLKDGYTYLLRAESWVHEDGAIWLISPLESTYLRIFEGEVLVHENAADLNYKKALTLDAFADQYTDYLTEHPADPAELQRHYEEIRTTLQSYDYRNKELAYQLDDEAIAARKQLADSWGR